MALELSQAPTELRALYRGVVVGVLPRQGITIQVTGTLIQAAWGDGGEGYGVLKRVVETPAEVLTEDKIDVSVHGTVMLAGAGITEAALRQAVKQEAAGLIIGGLLPSLKPLVMSLGYRPS